MGGVLRAAYGGGSARASERVLEILRLESCGMVSSSVHLCGHAPDTSTAMVDPVYAHLRDCELTVSGGNEPNAR